MSGKTISPLKAKDLLKMWSYSWNKSQEAFAAFQSQMFVQRTQRPAPSHPSSHIEDGMPLVVAAGYAPQENHSSANSGLGHSRCKKRENWKESNDLLINMDGLGNSNDTFSC